MQLEPLKKTPWETVQDRAKHPAESKSWNWTVTMLQHDLSSTTQYDLFPSDLLKCWIVYFHNGRMISHAFYSVTALPIPWYLGCAANGRIAHAPGALGYTSTKHASVLWIPMKIDENPLVYQSGNEIVSLSALSPCQSV